MTARAQDDVPFDIASYRVVFYEQSIAGADRLKRDLDKAVKELLTSLQRTNNPVQEMLASKSRWCEAEDTALRANQHGLAPESRPSLTLTRTGPIMAQFWRDKRCLSDPFEEGGGELQSLLLL